jgi:hypothetical protein
MYSSLEFRQLKRCRKHIFLILIAFMLAGFIAAEQGARVRCRQDGAQRNCSMETAFPLRRVLLSSSCSKQKRE